MDKLKDKIALICGGSRIDTKVAKAFSGEGSGQNQVAPVITLEFDPCISHLAIETKKNLNLKKLNFRSSVLVLCLIVASQQARAQTASDLVKEWERSKAYTREYLEAMPESAYVLKPTSQMRSFAEQLLHLADANYGLAAAAIGIKSPFNVGELEKNSDKSKANVSKLVLASYDYVIDELKKMSESQLNKTIKMLGKFDMSKRMAVAKVFEHQAHHRGQTTVYLRLAGVTPPQEQLF